MSYPASETAGIIRLVEQPHPPVRRALDGLGLPRATFWRWVELHRTGGPEARDARPSRPSRVWSRLPDEVRTKVIALALDQPELSPRGLAGRLAGHGRHFVPEASVHRLLKAHDLITSPACCVVKAADGFTDRTTAPNELWPTDFTYLEVAGWRHLSAVLDDLPRFVVAWTLCTTRRAEDVSATLDLALAASGLDQVKVRHRPRPLSDTGSSCIAGDLAERLTDRGTPHPGRPPSSPNARQGRAPAPDAQEPHPARAPPPAGRPGGAGRSLRRAPRPRPARESLSTLTPADLRVGRGEAVPAERARISEHTTTTRRSHHHARAAQPHPQMDQTPRS